MRVLFLIDAFYIFEICHERKPLCVPKNNELIMLNNKKMNLSSSDLQGDTNK